MSFPIENLKLTSQEDVFSLSLYDSVSLDGDVIEQKALSFPEILSKLPKEWLVIEKIPRPDIQITEKCFDVYLSPMQKQTVRLQQQVYINRQEDKYIFSSSPTGLSFILKEIQGDRIAIEFIATFAALNMQKQQKEFFLPLIQQKSADTMQLQKNVIFSQLAQAQFWGPDIIYKTIYSSENQKVNVKQRIRITTLSTVNEYQLDEKDWLYFTNGQWQVTQDLQKAERMPLAHIKSIQERAIEIEGWDEISEERFVFTLKLQTSDPLIMQPQELLRSLRLKTKRQVSFQVDKQFIVMREGDALYKNSKGSWEIIKNFRASTQQMEKIQAFPVLYFEKVLLKEGMKYFKGFIFNSMHSERLSVELPIQITGIKSSPYTEKLQRQEISRNSGK